MKNLAFILIVTLLVCSCSKNSTENQKTKKTSSTQSIVEDITGHTAIKSGKRATDKVKKVSAAHEKDLNDILGE